MHREGSSSAHVHTPSIPLYVSCGWILGKILTEINHQIFIKSVSLPMVGRSFWYSIMMHLLIALALFDMQSMIAFALLLAHTINQLAPLSNP
jgi:hypothetical protein